MNGNQLKFQPLVSIVIPVYNGSNYVREAIDGALAQTYKNVEVIVVNDGSTDDTEEIALSYGSKIRYFSKENGGVSSALNAALREMKGEYFSWLSHDDIYYPDKIEKQITFLSSFGKPNVISYSDYELIDEQSKRVGNVRLSHRMLRRKPEYGLLRGSINGITLLIPRQAFSDHGNFDESLKVTQDYAKWFEMMRSYRFIHMPDVLAKSRTHEMQDTRKNPLVETEGDALWIRMMEELPLETKVRLEGGELKFYERMVYFLRSTPYREAMAYANRQANEIRSSNGLRVVDYTKRMVFPDRRRLKEKVRFVMRSPRKFVKKYFRIA